MIKAASYFVLALTLGTSTRMAAESATRPAALPATQAAGESVATPPGTHPSTQPAGFLETNGATQPATQPITVASAQPTTQATTRLASSRPTTGPATNRPTPPTYATRNGPSRSAPAAPAAPGAPTFVSRPMPKEYALLSTRSIFQRGKLRVVVEASTTPTEPTTIPSYNNRETSLVFNGVTRTDDEAVALIEDRIGRTVIKVRIGDALARGKVAAITLNMLDYDARGRITHVAIGQTLDGMTAAPASTQPSPIAASGTTGSGSTPSTGPGQLSGGAADILERLRQKRLQETGGN